MNVDSLQPYLDIAVSVLAKQDALATQKLKVFLVSMPSAKQIEQTLGFAVVQLAAQDLSAFEWILANQLILMPELDLKAFAEKMARDRLRDRVTSETLQSQGADTLKAIALALQSDRPEREESQLSVVFDQPFSPGERLLLQSVLSFEAVTTPIVES